LSKKAATHGAAKAAGTTAAVASRVPKTGNRAPNEVVAGLEAEYRALERQQLSIAQRMRALKLTAESLLPRLAWGDRLPITEGKHAGRKLFVQGVSATWVAYESDHHFLFRAHGMVCNANGELGKGERPREYVAIEPLVTPGAPSLAAVDTLASR